MSPAMTFTIIPGYVTKVLTSGTYAANAADDWGARLTYWAGRGVSAAVVTLRG